MFEIFSFFTSSHRLYKSIKQINQLQIFSTATAFYIPLCAIISIYYKIMRAAKSRFKRERERRKTANYSHKSTKQQGQHGNLIKVCILVFLNLKF